MQRISIILFFILSSLCSFSQIKNIVFTLHLKNGDILTGTTDITEIKLETNYGKLLFPVGDINSINIGIHNTSFDKANLIDLLEILDSKNKNNSAKEKAFDNIVEMNEGAIPFIKSYLQNSKEFDDSDLSVSILYEVMLSKYNVKNNFSVYDEVIFDGKNSIKGTYEFENIVLETEYGRIRIQRKSIKSIDIKILTKDGFSKNNTFKLFANKYVSGNKEDGWLNTKILVKKGDKLKILADGTIRLASLSGNTYSPDGGINGAPGPLDKKINYGQLLFKISQSGKPQKAGDNIDITIEKTGVLYLSIFETVYNPANTGYYSAKVKLK